MSPSEPGAGPSFPALETRDDSIAALCESALDGVRRQTDRLFAALLPIQWLAALVVAQVASPRTWAGASSRVHEHVWAALALGLAIVSFPTVLALARPGRVASRHAVAAGQMLIGALLIHVSGGRIETHFHIFGSLALLAFYRDWPVLMTATAVVAADHLLRGFYWPLSIYGVAAASPWRAAEHAGWVLLIDVFLVRSCRQAVRETREVAARQVALEATRAGIEETVRLRTAELTDRTEELRRVADRLGERDARLSATAAFAEALNQPEALATYESALRCLARELRAPVAAMYTAGPDGHPPASRCAVTLDGEALESPLFSGEGLPAEVARTGETRSLHGPFGGGLRVRVGLGEAELCRVVGWPVSFNRRPVGVLLTAHVVPPTDEQDAFVRSALNQLAVRMSAFGVEEQRLRLVADLREQSRALEEARQEAERANRVKSEFLASMSHELRTPMNSIMGFTARLIRKLGPTLAERELDALNTVDRNARHLLGLINDILDLSKIEAGKMELDRERLDLAAVAREAFDQAGALADGKPIELGFEGPTGPVILEGDRVKLRQVAMNLISNAVKYTDRGEVRVAVAEEDDRVLGRVARLSVRDTGVGIRPEDRERLFQRFTQLDAGPTRKAGGTGLGLVITDQLVRMHGGRIDVRSEPGRGSEFAAILPLSAPAASLSAGPGPAAVLHRTSRTPLARGVTVLCVDDGPGAMKDLEVAFRDAGYRAVLAGDHEAALAAARDERPDVLCLDLAMPGRDGFESLRGLDSDPGLASIPVIVVSASGDQARALGAGARCYLAKPVDERGLVATVGELMGRRTGTALVIEDNPDVAKLVSATLAESGLQVRLAGDGREGLARLAEATPSVIILDLMMPVMDGFSFLDHLQLDPVWKSIPVAILTAKELEPGELLRLRSVGAAVLASGRDDARKVIESVLASVRPGRSRAAREAVA